MNEKIIGLPIFYKLLFAFWGAMILLGGVWTSFFYYSSMAAIERSVEGTIVQQMDTLSGEMNDDLQNELARDIRLMASNPSVDEYLTSSEAERAVNAIKVERLFMKYIDSTPHYESISFVDSTGREKIGVDRNGRVKTYRDYSRSELYAKLESGDPGTIRYVGPYKDEHQHYIISTGISMTDADIGKFGGLVIVNYNLEDFLSNARNIRILDEKPVWVLTTGGQVLQQPANSRDALDPRPYLAKTAQQESRFMAVDDGMVVYQDIYLLSDQPLIRAIISVPDSLLFKNIRSVVRPLLIVSALALLLISALAYYLSRYLSRPIIDLARAATRLSTGDLASRVQAKSTGEVQVLIDSFNQMAANLDRTTVSKQELEVQVKQRTRQLLEAQEDLVRKEKLALLGQVAGSVGHELRNPLGVMSNAVYFLQTVLSDADDSVKEYLGIIKNEIAGSERIVSDLLDSVRTRPPQPETVDIAQLIEQTLPKCSVPASVSVKLDIPATLSPLQVDPQQIHQVFRNLISNAIEAMPQGGTLEIRAVEHKKDGTVTVSVRDSGTGMTPEQLGKLFQPLYTTKARGIGLGLVVVKNLVEANGGTVEVQSESGKGTVFAVTLPCDAAATA